MQAGDAIVLGVLITQIFPGEHHYLIVACLLFTLHIAGMYCRIKFLKHLVEPDKDIELPEAVKPNRSLGRGEKSHIWQLEVRSLSHVIV